MRVASLENVTDRRTLISDTRRRTFRLPGSPSGVGAVEHVPSGIHSPMSVSVGQCATTLAGWGSSLNINSRYNVNSRRRGTMRRDVRERHSRGRGGDREEETVQEAEEPGTRRGTLMRCGREIGWPATGPIPRECSNMIKY